MPATVQSILAAATAEWAFWGRSTWDVARRQRHVGHTDDETPFAQHVIDHYCSVGGGQPTLSDIADDRYFWSAVGISAVMKNAGLTKREFPFAQSHSRFIRHFVAARKAGDALALYWGFRRGEPGGEPMPGDLVAYARGRGVTPARAARLFDATSSYESHSDVVVARRADEIDVIGCNVLDSVTRKTLRLDATGHIADTAHHWFVTLKWRGA